MQQSKGVFVAVHMVACTQTHLKPLDFYTFCRGHADRASPTATHPSRPYGRIRKANPWRTRAGRPPPNRPRHRRAGQGCASGRQAFIDQTRNVGGHKRKPAAIAITRTPTSSAPGNRHAVTSSMVHEKETARLDDIDYQQGSILWNNRPWFG